MGKVLTVKVEHFQAPTLGIFKRLSRVANAGEQHFGRTELALGRGILTRDVG
jgi:hypothetical protein